MALGHPGEPLNFTVPRVVSCRTGAHLYNATYLKLQSKA
jgi:hypothetical protein